MFNHWQEQTFHDLNRQMPLDQPPQKQLPQWGRWVETPRLIAIFLPACDLQANFTAPFDLISTRFEPGEGIAAFNSDQLQDYRAEPGGFDVIPKNSTYRSIETMGGPSIILAFKQLNNSLVARQLNQTPILTPGQVQATTKGIEIAHAMRSLLNQKSGDAIHLESLATLALGNVTTLIPDNNHQGRSLPDRLRPKQLNTVLTFILSHLNEQLCLAQLASTIQFNPHYFAHAFKATTGISPYQYVLHRRVAYARELLVKTNRPLIDIAYDAGFGSQSHMTTVFRRILQMTPLQCRQQMSASPSVDRAEDIHIH